jgi:hypothetical protein
MRQRVQDIGGKYEIQTATGRGTSIIVTVPILYALGAPRSVVCSASSQKTHSKVDP